MGGLMPRGPVGLMPRGPVGSFMARTVGPLDLFLDLLLDLMNSIMDLLDLLDILHMLDLKDIGSGILNSEAARFLRDLPMDLLLLWTLALLLEGNGGLQRQLLNLHRPSSTLGAQMALLMCHQKRNSRPWGGSST